VVVVGGGITKKKEKMQSGPPPNAILGTTTTSQQQPMIPQLPQLQQQQPTTIPVPKRTKGEGGSSFQSSTPIQPHKFSQAFLSSVTNTNNSNSSTSTSHHHPHHGIIATTTTTSSSSGIIGSGTLLPNPNIPGAGSVYGNAAGYLPTPPQPPPTTDGHTMRAIRDRLEGLWAEQKKETSMLRPDSKKDFKTMNDLPLARIKRVMKSDEDVRMISAEAPILFAKACEIFVLDLTIRSWAYSEHNKRGGLEREDVLQVLKETDIFDFLAEVMIVPSDPAKMRKPTQ
jgi:nuclear transcription factor Y gamma